MESSYFFEINNGPYLVNNLSSRLFCIKDFFKKVLFLPLALIQKLAKTAGRAVGVCFGALVILITVGSSPAARELFVNRVGALAKDLADWILLPFALLGCFFRLLLALFIHPSFYFNA
jgi:tetrahydromethanopterin S-methyltransferase subunit G